ncbi:hypothetical protein HNP38_002293 [Chryseobacterium defluvii]|uniref:Lipoprotein n=1 Tax=Chryseobacterium defluvii TaxID=160396 RepID=A0A840KG94_9FLAO|nr:hypothetical protein [Chryseobacterium defluvii]
MRYMIFLILFFLISCKNEKLTYKKIETKDYLIEGYTYINNTNKVFPNELIIVDKTSKDTIFHCMRCYTDFHMILQDTLLIYGGNKLDSTLAHGIILKRRPVPQGYKYNLPYKSSE